MDGTSTGQRGRNASEGARRLRAREVGSTHIRRPAHASWLRFDALPRRGPWVRRGAWLPIILSFACQGSVQADAKVAGDGELDADIKSFDRPLEAPVTPPQPLPEHDFTGSSHALLGARHDLSYAGPKTATCACLAVALRDRAKDEAFAWQLEEPAVEPTSQWIIALSSNEVPCDAPPSGTLGASYQGYAQDGNDVVVYVEALGEGRPMTSGAIIPRPKPSGSVFVEPTNAVYGKPLEGKSKRCKLAAPAEPKP